MFCRHLAFLLLLVPLLTFAQPPMATLTGQVVDALTGQPVPGASLFLVPGNISLTATSDSAGYFRMSAIPVGHFALRAAALGYDTLEVPEMWLRAGKQAEQQLELSPTGKELSSVTISAMAREQVSPLGVKAFTVEQSLRWPATSFDPGRVVTAFPGVAGANDGTNHLIIRGNSPNANAWTLEGVEIVNPNHLSNAGTPTDLPTLSGGGVIILSAQMLGPSQLLTGVLPIDRDNALGGIMDMRLRNGNMHGQEWTVQAGLTGLDLSTEGPIGSGERSSWLANYRYSTVGLLSAIGVPLGDEAVTFQDLSFHVTLPAGKRGELHLFGLGGNSSNVFEAEHDTAKWEFDKDSKNIDYTSRTGAVGGSVKVPVGKRTTFTSSIAISETDQDRIEDALLSDYSIGYHIDAKLSERKLSGMAQVEGAVGARFRYAIGGSATDRRLTSELNNDLSGWLLRPWLNGTWALNEHWQAMVGVGVSYFTFTGETAAEPRATLEWRMAHGAKLALAAGMRSQLPQWQSFQVSQPWFLQDAIGLTRSQDLVLGYDRSIKERLTVHVETYYQYITDVPVDGMGYYSGYIDNLSLMNIWDEQVYIPLQSTGTATNMGIEVGVDHHFANNFFYRANASLYNSTYTMAGGEELDTRWNGQTIFNLLGGKEFKKVKEDRVRTWGISGRLNVAGGMRTMPLPTYTDINGNILFAGEHALGQLPTYYRIDLRVYLKKDRNGRTGMWSVDLQNVTNAQNAQYYYYDYRKGEVVTKYQLGIIPNLSYRVEF
ncbi:MAG: TonB-dependent receptor [Flavobacteriales bacterium]|jgi:hypothetical protein|nr:TonB-dependent receptor [Flavobacteriales bacterium]